MNIINKFPYTDFHELNLDFILRDIKKLSDKISSLLFDLRLDNSNDNKLLLKDKDNNTISSVTVAYSSRSGHSDTSDTSGTAETATRASEAVTDVNGNNITGYVKTVESSGNLITFKNGDNNTVASVTVTTGDITIVDLVTPEETASVYGYYLYDLLDALFVDGEIALKSNYTAGQISTLMQNGNGVYIRHKHNRSEVYDAFVPLTMNPTLYFIYDLKTFKIIPNNATSVKIQRVN